tara:strand:+ start:182 stop:919 length:738 start_codon:yes stop_codon:yes gene_type:complete
MLRMSTIPRPSEFLNLCPEDVNPWSDCTFTSIDDQYARFATAKCDIWNTHASEHGTGNPYLNVNFETDHMESYPVPEPFTAPEAVPHAVSPGKYDNADPGPVPAPPTTSPPKMVRPRRQAAQQAMKRMKTVKEWENCSENSTLFRSVAHQFEKEFAHMTEEERDDEKMNNESEEGDDSGDDEEEYESSFVSEDSESCQDSESWSEEEADEGSEENNSCDSEGTDDTVKGSGTEDRDAETEWIVVD